MPLRDLRCDAVRGARCVYPRKAYPGPTGCSRARDGRYWGGWRVEGLVRCPLRNLRDLADRRHPRFARLARVCDCMHRAHLKCWPKKSQKNLNTRRASGAIGDRAPRREGERERTSAMTLSPAAPRRLCVPVSTPTSQPAARPTPNPRRVNEPSHRPRAHFAPSAPTLALTLLAPPLLFAGTLRWTWTRMRCPS